MTSLIGARRRAEEFDAALSSRTRGAEASPEMSALLSVVDTLRTQEAPAPRADFSARLREQLMAEAAETLTPSTVLTLPPRRHNARERRLTIAASAFVLIGGSAGMAAAAQNAAPGDALYPLKRGLETAQRSIATDDAAKGQAFLAQADDRLAEARTLAGRDATSAEIGQSLSSFSAQAVTGSDLILGSFEDDRDPALVQELRSFTADALESLSALAAVAPADLADEIAQAGFVLQSIDAAAAQACTDCSDLPALVVPGDMQLTAEVQRATRRVQIDKPDNSHPAAAVPLPVTSPDAPDGGTGGTDTPDGPADGPSVGVVGKGSELPRDPQDLVGAVDDATGGLLGSVGDTTGEILPDELDGTTEDLLP
jgi:hypothetical protein